MKADGYDALVIGAGHNGLTLALYLRRAGLNVLVLEQAEEVGGMSRSEEPLEPGFRHNPHANFLAYLDLMPVVRDFDLASHGLRTLHPEAQHGIAFSDGRPPVVLHRSDLMARTTASLGRYSSRDAEAYAELKQAADGLSDLLAEGMFAPADPRWFKRQAQVLAEVARKAGLPPPGQGTARSLIDSAFEAPEARALLYQLAAEFGARLEDPGSDLSFLGLSLWLVGHWRLPVGGMQAVPNAMRRAAEALGVTVATKSRVTKIDVRAGRVRSVHVAGHGRVAARIVASSAGLAPTLLKLVEGSALSAGERAEVRRFAATPTTGLASLMFCLRDPPAYRSARWDADIDRCFHTLVGFDGPQEVLDHLADVERGALPTPAAAVRVNTLWDSSQAPAGRHVAGSDAFMPNHADLDADTWAAVAASYNDAFLDRWAAFAPNMTRDNVIADLCELPGDYERKMRFQVGADQYRTEVSGLYLCGASTYPGGGMHGACGYNAFQAIAQDHALPHAGSHPAS